MNDEMLDLVDRNDTVIGTINRMNYQRILDENLGYIRAVDLFIINSNGQVYAPIRTADKTIAPNGYDFSVGGHVGSGEDYIGTLLREANEELNLVVDPKEVKLIDKTILDEIRYIRHLYLLKSDITPDFNPADFVTAEWMMPSDLIKEIENGHPAKSSLRSSLIILKEWLASE
jgi:isopentenyl-diphosphate delta-isomerase